MNDEQVKAMLEAMFGKCCTLYEARTKAIAGPAKESFDIDQIEALIQQGYRDGLRRAAAALEVARNEEHHSTDSLDPCCVLSVEQLRLDVLALIDQPMANLDAPGLLKAAAFLREEAKDKKKPHTQWLMEEWATNIEALADNED